MFAFPLASSRTLDCPINEKAESINWMLGIPLTLDKLSGWWWEEHQESVAVGTPTGAIPKCRVKHRLVRRVHMSSEQIKQK